jgi:Holliday junction resolvase
MNRKNKGSNAERELVHMFWKNNWACLRAAGSGSTRYCCPDIICGNTTRRIAIECKSTKDKFKYLTKKEVEDLIFFSKKFGTESWIGVRFDNINWFFLNPEDLFETDKNYKIDIESAKRKGLLFEELIDVKNEVLNN